MTGQSWQGFSTKYLALLSHNSRWSAPADASMFRPLTTENGHRTGGIIDGDGSG